MQSWVLHRLALSSIGWLGPVQRIAVGNRLDRNQHNKDRKRKERPQRWRMHDESQRKTVRCRQNTIVQPSFFACSWVYETPSTFNAFLSKTVIKPPLFPS